MHRKTVTIALIASIALAFSLLYGCRNDSKENRIDEVNIEMEVLKKDETGNPVYKLVFLKNGVTIAERTYAGGENVHSSGDIPNGPVLERYSAGKLRNILVYKNGKRNGPAYGFYENGNLRFEANYKDGNPYGVGKHYYENGMLMEEYEIIDGKETYHKEYSEDGRLRNSK